MTKDFALIKVWIWTNVNTFYYLCVVKYVLIAIVCLFSLTASAQSDWHEALQSWMTEEDVEESYSEETMELLAEMADFKINLNQTSREELERLPFLSALQVEGIMEYIDRYHPLRSLNELLMVNSLDWNTRRLLLHFVYIGEETPKRIWPSLADVRKYGKQQVLATLKVPFYERKGDRTDYLGYRYRHDIRYQFNYNDRVKFGLTAAQDAGEPFFANKNGLGYDHYSYYFQLRKMGKLEELNLGMYRVQMGMGLLMNTGFYLGKTAMLSSLGRATHMLTAHSSRSSFGYFQGAATTVRLTPRWVTTAFVSWRHVDATLNDNGSIRTIVRDGYHRTATELEKKNNTQEFDAGFRIGWKPVVRRGTPFLNFNMVYTHFDRRLIPPAETPSQLYRRYSLAGNDFLNMSLDYGYTHPRFSFSGETAMNRDGGLAAIHVVSWRLADTWTAMLLHRYYGLRYTAYHARSFSEGSSVQNEHGIYAGLTWTPSRTFSLQGYADYAHFPGPRYMVSAASDAFDASLLARTLYNKYKIEARYRLHLRQRDNEEKTFLLNRFEHHARLRLSFPVLAVNLQSQADGSLINTRSGNSYGVMFSEQASYQYRSLRVDAHVGWFHTDDYDSRLYQYERSALYDFSFPMYYGHGLRYALMARIDYRRLMFTAKLGVTDYFDRSVISSGLQQIDGSSQADLLLQLRYKF